MRQLSSIGIVLLTGLFVSAAWAGEVDQKPDAWTVGEPVFLHGPAGTFDAVAVKDPTIVFFEGTWHLFYTARSQAEYSTGYVSAKTLADLQSAPRHQLKMIRGQEQYGCAPQVFYFAPQRKWYLIFQTFDSNYQPRYSTTATIADPESWSRPEPLLTKDAKAKWIDFWVICDDERAYLFYTQNHTDVMVRSTSLERFPEGWGESKPVFPAVHEAVHVYKAKGRSEYHMIYELNHGGVRSFGLATAEHLAGPWKKATDEYATGEQLTYVGQGKPWTEMASHGEILRSGYDQRLEYEPERCRWLIQGILRSERKGRYELLPWKLGVIELKAPGKTQSTVKGE